MPGTPLDMTVRLLGPVDVVRDGAVLTLGSPKQQAVLATLALAGGAPVTTDRLIDLLWADSPPGSAAATLRSLVYRLRQTLGTETLSGTGSGYHLAVPSEAVDALRFGRLTTEADAARDRGDLPAAAESLSAALALWRGPALGDVAHLPGLANPASQLEAGRAEAVETLAEVSLALGRPAQAVALLEPLLADQPLREAAWHLLMVALYRLGRQADALAAFDRVRRTLADELGLDPGPALRDLHVAILEQRGDLLGPQASSRPAGHRLPEPTSSFVGRATEIAEIVTLLDRTRLVTLTGPGGAGKTRLALAVADRVADGHTDGAWFIDLLAVRDPAAVDHAITASLGFDPAALGAAPEALVEAMCEQLRHRRSLIVLDNCEHVVGAAARVAQTIVARCPHVVLLATSRESLAVPGETIVRVGSLSLPAAGTAEFSEIAGTDAVTLFCARAADHDRDFALTAANAVDVARVVRRLDGIPLALELAAARVRLLGPARLSERLDDRFRLLVGGARTADTRHRTLAAAIDWSYDLLDDQERTVLRRLSVFPAEFSLEAAEAVAGDDGVDVLDVLARLADKSLLGPVPGTSARFRLLETVREYATARLAEAEEPGAIRTRHCTYFAAPIDPWPTFTRGEVMRRAAVEAENLRAAMAWAREIGAADALHRMIAAQIAYWYVAGAADVLVWVEAAAALPTPPDEPAATIVPVFLAALLETTRGERAGGSALRADALALAVQRQVLDAQCWVRAFMAEAEIAAGRLTAAEEVLAPVLPVLAEVGQPSLTAWFWCLQAELAAARDNIDEAYVLAERGLAAIGPETDDYRVAHVRGFLAVLASAAGRPDVADAHAAGALRVARAIPGRRHILMALARAAETAVLSGRADRARELLDELLAAARESGGDGWVAEALELTALVIGDERPRTAAALLGTAQAVRGVAGEEAGVQPVLAGLLARCRSATVEALGSRAAAEERERGAGLHPAEALAWARSELARPYLVPSAPHEVPTG